MDNKFAKKDLEKIELIRDEKLRNLFACTLFFSDNSSIALSGADGEIVFELIQKITKREEAFLLIAKDMLGAKII